MSLSQCLTREVEKRAFLLAFIEADHRCEFNVRCSDDLGRELVPQKTLEFDKSDQNFVLFHQFSVDSYFHIGVQREINN